MKKIIGLFVTFTAFAAIGTFSSCTKTCDAGYEGNDCKTVITAKFLGDWKGTDSCTTGTYSNITVTTTSQSNVVNVSIKNIGGFGSTEVITGSLPSGSTNQLTFTNQELSGNRTISGTMTFSGNTMTTSYTVTPDSGSPDVCSGSYTKL